MPLDPDVSEFFSQKVKEFEAAATDAIKKNTEERKEVIGSLVGETNKLLREIGIDLKDLKHNVSEIRSFLVEEAKKTSPASTRASSGDKTAPEASPTPSKSSSNLLGIIIATAVVAGIALYGYNSFRKAKPEDKPEIKITEDQAAVEALEKYATKLKTERETQSKLKKLVAEITGSTPEVATSALPPVPAPDQTPGPATGPSTTQGIRLNVPLPTREQILEAWEHKLTCAHKTDQESEKCSRCKVASPTTTTSKTVEVDKENPNWKFEFQEPVSVTGGKIVFNTTTAPSK